LYVLSSHLLLGEWEVSRSIKRVLGREKVTRNIKIVLEGGEVINKNANRLEEKKCLKE
jgi:hypothetical protein